MYFQYPKTSYFLSKRIFFPNVKGCFSYSEVPLENIVYPNIKKGKYNMILRKILLATVFLLYLTVKPTSHVTSESIFGSYKTIAKI